MPTPSMVKRILASLSGTPYTPSVIAHSLELAKIHDAEVTGVTIINPEAVTNVGPVPVGGGAFATELREHRWAITEKRMEEEVDRFETACREAGVAFRVVREQGNPFEELISLWRYHDLTLIGLRGIFDYGVVKNPADYLKRLIRVGVRPILAVSKKPREIRRVMIAYSGSMESAKAMKGFVHRHLWPEVEVKVVCFDREPHKAERLLADAASYCQRHGLEVSTECFESPPREGLLREAANWRADLIVMGSTGRWRIFQHIIGDTALRAIRRSDLPLFLTQ